jgi:hypothetical protein
MQSRVLASFRLSGTGALRACLTLAYRIFAVSPFDGLKNEEKPFSL